MIGAGRQCGVTRRRRCGAWRSASEVPHRRAQDGGRRPQVGTARPPSSGWAAYDEGESALRARLDSVATSAATLPDAARMAAPAR